jgi:hypothetical protein
VTLIVGVKCTNGIALAADTRISFGTAIQPDTAHKLDVVSEDAILGVSGSKAVAQEHLLELKRLARAHSPWPYTNVDEAKQFFGAALAGRFKRMTDRITQSPLAGDVSELDHETVVACTIPAARTTHLIYYDKHFIGTEINDFYPLHAIGSGTEAALFFGSFIRAMVYRDQIPTVRQGLIGAYWIVDMAIKCHTLGVGGKVDCACLRVDGETPVAGLLTEPQLAEIRGFLNDAVDSISELFRKYPGWERDGVAE